MTSVTTAPPLTAYADATAPAALSRVAPDFIAGMSHEHADQLSLAIYTSLATVETQWRGFEKLADGTAFQTFEWLSAWQRHIGRRAGTIPIIAVASFGTGETACILPLAIHPGRFARRICWLGQEQCDYNAPLLAPDFAQRVSAGAFLALWDELQERVQSDPDLRFDWIELQKMPHTIGAQINPLAHLRVTPHASGAHLTRLGGDWEQFYFAKRSSATRRRDRAKRRHISAYGEIRFITVTDAADARRTLETLMDQKSRALARRGIRDIFATAGMREFLLDVATNPKLRHLVHVSRIEVGSAVAAANFALVSGGRYYHVLASYDEASPLAHYGPGVLHLRELLAYAIGRGLRWFDFTIGDEQYKLEWSDTYLRLYDYSAAATARGRPANGVSKVRRRLKRFVKQTPFVWHLVSRFRAHLGGWLSPGPIASDGARDKAQRAASASGPMACVMGDMDLLQPIGTSGIRCAVVTHAGVPSLYSRHVRTRLCWEDFAENEDKLLGRLLQFARAQNEPPVLFFQDDAQLLFVSRHRDRLAQAFRFVLADVELIETLLDKARFQKLAERMDLPVPPTRHFHPVAAEPDDLELDFPVVIKPLTRLRRWSGTFGLQKALEANDLNELRALWPRLLDAGIDVLAQEQVPGPETRIESYHCYVDRSGSVAAEFTGRKLRTYPLAYGHTTALEITDAPDVQRLGRDIVERLELSGVAKLDFKRDPAGRLRLLEINPRFTLWHHAAAAAGLNIPQLVYADLAGLPRPAATRAKVGVRWCRPWHDLLAARASGLSFAEWLIWLYGCEAKSALAWNDPMPLVQAALHRLVAGGGRKAAPDPEWERLRP